jgi:PAS domain S-box-containing protein
MLSPKKETIWQYGLSIGVFGLTLLFTYLLWPFITPAADLLFLAAIMIAAYYGGLGPGLLASALSSLTFNYFFVPPYNGFELTFSNAVRAGIFMFVALLISWLNAMRRRLIDDIRLRELEREELLSRISGFNDELQQKVATATAGVSSASDALQREIASHLEMKKMLREQQERFEFVAKATNDLIYDWDIPADKVLFNEAAKAILGFSGREKTGARESWLALVHPEDRERLEREFEEFFTRGKNLWSTEYRLRRKDGKYITLLDQAFLIYDDEGRPYRFIGTSSDITKRVEEEEARQKILQRVVAAHEEERKRIARDLHDQLSQHLITLNLGLESLKGVDSLPEIVLERIKELQKLLDDLAEEAYRIERNLHPAVLEEAELPDALREYAEQWSRQTGVPLESDFDPSCKGFSLQAKTSLYRIFQESLTNIYKHAGATRVSVSLKKRNGEVLLVVEDDGAGFNFNEPKEMITTGGLGLRSMRERVELLGGHFEIESGSGRGTTVFVRLPLERLTDERKGSDGKAEDSTGG